VWTGASSLDQLSCLRSLITSKPLGVTRGSAISDHRKRLQYVSTIRQTIPEPVRQEYRDEIEALVQELRKLLPQFRIKMDNNQYASVRQEVMCLEVYACDDSLDLFALEALRQHLESHRKMFATALGESA
jgi:hypothetical protein